MNTFQEYPKKMVHPQHEAAKWKTLEGKGVGLFAPDTIMTAPERFPDVQVTTKEQEQYYAARGYRPNNMANPQEYEQAILESAPVDGYGFQAFPKWKYHAMEMPVIVKTAQEESNLGSSWSDTPIIATEDDLIEAATPAPEQAAESAPDSAPRAPVVAKPKAKAKEPAKVDKRSKAYRAAQAQA
jgi:hypothetical protein